MKTQDTRNYYQLIIGLGLVVRLAASDPAQAQSPQSETRKLVAEDSATDKLFGYSVALWGSTALIGAGGDTENGSFSGAVYLFDVQAGQQLLKLVPADGSAEDFFGGSVALSQSHALIGAPSDDDKGSESGSAYVFDASNGQQLFKLHPADGVTGDGFGSSAALSTSTAVIGASGKANFTGAAYVFDLETGQQRVKLVSNDGVAFDSFGQSVAVSGNTAIVGAPFQADLAGAAYLFDVSTGVQLFKLLPPDNAPETFFGWSVAIEGRIAVVGAQGYNGDAGENSGAVFLYDATTGQQIAKLQPQDAEQYGTFGEGLAIHGNILAVGATANGAAFSSHLASAYLFDLASQQQLAKFVHSDREQNDGFGTTIALNGHTAIFGAYLDSIGNGPATLNTAGSAYVYRINQSPIADASATRLFWTSANGIDANVVLDGSRSFDPDDDPLSYRWVLGGTPIQTGIIAVVTLPVGMHDLDLLVDDGMAQDIGSLRIHVLTAAQSVERLTSLVENSGLQKQQQLQASLQAALASIQRGNHIPAVNQLHAFLHKLQAQVAPYDPALAAELSRLTTEIISALAGNGSRGGAAKTHRVNQALRGQVR